MSTRPRTGLPAALALAMAAAGTTWVATFSWRELTEATPRYLGPLLVLGAVVAGTGALARWARFSAPVVVLAQVVLSGALASAMLSGSPIPVGSAWVRLDEKFSDAAFAAEQYAAPVPSHVEGVHPFLIVGGLACLLLVDFLACTLRRVPLAGLPLLTVYSVPVSLVLGGVSWWIFAATAGGFLLMLYLQESEQLNRWGRPLGSEADADPTAFGVRTGAVRATAGTIGGVATGLAVFLPLLVPTLNLNVLSGGPGTGDDEIRLTNPMTDLRRDLTRGEDIALLQVRTNDPSPSYMRISALTRFSDNEWSAGNREVPIEQRATGEMPLLQGVSAQVPRTESSYQVSVSDAFESAWLPTMAPISSISASGDWRYDEETMDFLSGDRGHTTAGLDYSMTGVELDLSANSMALAPATGGLVSDDYVDLPDDLSRIISNTAFQVTRNEESRFEKAVALQQWFRETGGFRYTLDAEPGNGEDELVRFLTDGEGGKAGYCEQFASAMAVLARTLGIPARVAVGFLQPDQVGSDTWEYSSHDMHAWPELFFPGSGWVRFEPTPPGRASGVPGYTTERVVTPQDPEGAGGPRDLGLPSRGPSERPERDASSAGEEDQNEDAGFPWLPVAAGGAGGVLVVAALVLLPRTVRRRRTRNRIGSGPEAVWVELRDTAIDLGVPWPPGRSPRETRDQLVRYFGAPEPGHIERPAHGAYIAPAAVDALNRIVLTLERLRYARAEQAADESRLDEDLETCVASLYGGAPRSARRRASWWPRSVLRLRRMTVAPADAAPITVRYGGVVDHVG